VLATNCRPLKNGKGVSGRERPLGGANGRSLRYLSEFLEDETDKGVSRGGKHEGKGRIKKEGGSVLANLPKTAQRLMGGGGERSLEARSKERWSDRTRGSRIIAPT